MNFKHKYLTSQIIAYIGNKRKLLPLIYEGLHSLYKDFPSPASPEENSRPVQGLKFLDLFAGSGVVARLAKMLGCEVFVNDWEDYAHIINHAYIGINHREVQDLFPEEGGLSGLLLRLNQLQEPAVEEQYIAKYYAPAQFDIEAADYRKERLFYTRANALTIDKIRNKIEELYPPDNLLTDERKKARYLLLALLLYQAATHTNTSGVFKACHKGFGGHNGDALRRILAPIALPLPELCDSRQKMHIYKQDANQLVKEEFSYANLLDIAYLDPPYNQHQYGSNYHMLNTIALWDKPAVSMALDARGQLVEKAAIRKDWVKTRSPYCYPDTAETAFLDLVASLQARYILISYSTEGIIPFPRLQEICAKKGRLSLVSSDYIKYRGGKKSNNRSNKNIEFVLIIDTRQAFSSKNLHQLDRLLEMKKITLLFDKFFSAERLCRCFQTNGDGQKLHTCLGDREIVIDTKDYFQLEKPAYIGELGLHALKELSKKLEQAVCVNKIEELTEIMKKIEEADDTLYYIKLIPGVFKNLAHKKYKEQYFLWYGRIGQLAEKYPYFFEAIEKKMIAIHETALKRFMN